MNLSRTIETLAAKDADLILELINVIQPSSPWTHEHLRWQYFEPPAGAARLYGIRDGRRLVSFYAAVAHDFRMVERSVTARRVQDVMTHPDYRGRGFLHALAECCLRDIVAGGDVGFTFPNTRSENSFRRTGWTELCAVPWRKKQLDPTARTTRTQLVLQPVSMFDDGISDLWDSAGFSVGGRRDSKYLNWRYKKPGNSYLKFLVGDGAGLLVLKIYDDGPRRILHVCELLLRSYEPPNVHDVLLSCEAMGVANGASLMTAWLPASHPYSQAFTDAGLRLSEDSGRYVFVHSGKYGPCALSNAASWHLTQGDSDIY